MRVLVACEFSGIVREAFRVKGHDAWSCDLLPTEIPGQHIQGDVLAILNDGWDMMIAHPPCTRLCNSGVCWLDKRNLWWEMIDGALFFRKFLSANIKKIAIENPIPHKYALTIIGRKYDQIIQPWQFGHGETKATCFWLKGLEPLRYGPHIQGSFYDNRIPEPTKIAKGRVQRLHYLPPSPNRAKERSRTYWGIAEAMANQWG